MTTAEATHVPANVRLRLIADPSIVGRTVGRSEDRDGYQLIEVELPDGSRRRWRSTQVEVAPHAVTRSSAFSEGRFGGPSDLRRVLMLERLRGDLTDVFYSMGTSDTEFMPHQFKPVLRFVESITGRLLIADEVGLGKTIEAALIWKELEAREKARRLLVVCPSMLREKWCGELKRRFRIDARVAGVADLIGASRDALRDPSTSFALVSSFDAIRPRSERAKEERPPSARDQLEELLESNPAAPGFALFDYVVVDEAHYVRNRETATNRLVRTLNDAAAHMALLTATPIQLGEDNLYQLMRLVDPDRFEDREVFQRLVASNAPVVAAHDRLRRTPFHLDEARRVVAEARCGPLRDDPVLARVATALEETVVAPDERIELARAVERASVLSSAMVRSRKRDVLVNRVERNAVTIEVELRPVELAFYGRVTRAVLERSRHLADDARGAISRLALVTRQRQMASSMAAAARAWFADPDLREQLFEDFGLIDEATPTADLGIDAPDPVELERCDSKFAMLRDHLMARLAVDAREKLVLFSYFRGTLAYLGERLRREGVATFLIQGGIGSKDAVLAEFRDHPGPAVLLSSEVGSEGIDLQFCRTLINYDLPWNPMRVEQRIGRLDRIGQRSDKIHIVNLVLTETIEDRILERLYDRIGVFKQAIGDLEAIIGDTVQGLVLDLYRDELDDGEREARAEQTINALAERARSVGELEDQASNLVAFRDHLLDEVRQGRALGRWIEPDDLFAFAVDVLSERYPGSRFERRQDDGRVHRVALSPDAKVALESLIERDSPPRGTRLHAPGGAVDVTFDPHWQGALRPSPEFVDATHPLVLWLRDELRRDPASAYPASAIAVPAESAPVPPGFYVVAIDRWELEGLRRERRLRFAGHFLDGDAPLDALGAEQLVHHALRNGVRVPAEAFGEGLDVLAGALADLEHGLEDEFLRREDFFTDENASLCDRQLRAVESGAERRVAELRARLERLLASDTASGLRRTEPLVRANLAKAEERLAMQRQKLLVARDRVRSDRTETAGLVVAVR